MKKDSINFISRTLDHQTPESQGIGAYPLKTQKIIRIKLPPNQIGLQIDCLSCSSACTEKL